LKNCRRSGGRDRSGHGRPALRAATLRRSARLRCRHPIKRGGDGSGPSPLSDFTARHLDVRKYDSEPNRSSFADRAHSRRDAASDAVHGKPALIDDCAALLAPTRKSGNRAGEREFTGNGRMAVCSSFGQAIEGPSPVVWGMSSGLLALALGPGRRPESHFSAVSQIPSPNGLPTSWPSAGSRRDQGPIPRASRRAWSGSG